MIGDNTVYAISHSFLSHSRLEQFSNQNALDFIRDIGRRIKESTGEKQATSYLIQAIGIAIQRGNCQCILDTVKDSRKMDEVYYL